MDQASDTITVLRKQEQSYAVSDWALLEELEQTYSSGRRAPIVDAYAREKLASWCFQVIDYCEMNRETASIAFSYLDRYLCSSAGKKTRTVKSRFRLACMTCFYTAIKVHERTAMNPAVFTKLSEGTYSQNDFEQMEREIIDALRWKMHPPTPMSFVRCTLDLLPPGYFMKDQLDLLLELAHIQTEAAVTKHEFVAIKASTLAYCAIMNALENLNLNDDFLDKCDKIVSSALAVDHDKSRISDLQDALYEAVTSGPDNESFALAATSPPTSPKSNAPKLPVQVDSPRSVCS
ncbi:hypothetical protein FisN_8Lh219 [Fistulifera solaris]|uniref:Cyclin-like domain-containing protein n=1 Tax=Fistulifera solaris TaxID=1519565 RepID=A0A1Z5JN89_FISSO|nr:hypothetical protein FisN_8Lh219 [Fistulifera solaris]|eukprot:GAX15480.1 hypothetical protein FisN_8Lh219 [Fistulifera solaris]